MQRKKIVDTIIEKNGKILMLKRKFWPKNKLDLPGGYVNKGENLQTAAKREVKEESGLDIQIIKKLGRFDYFDREEKRDTVFIGKIIGGKLKKSREGEPIWVKLEQVTSDKLAFPQLHTRVLNKYKQYKKKLRIRPLD